MLWLIAFCFLLLAVHDTSEKKIHPAKCSIKLDLNTCLNGKNFEYQGCNREAELCRRTVNVTRINLEPYDAELIKDTLRTCCGQCINVSDGVTLKRVSEIADPATATSQFVFPVLAPPGTDRLYGYYFLPIVETPSVYYITNKSEDMLRKLIYSCVDMWPLVVIVLLLIVISGFICWFIETWWNQDEFPRPLFIGWFEGIWWSFISMSTVGYGDRVPKSVPARLFSIAWIFVGITTFSLVTALLSSEIIAANSVPPPTMVGQKIAAMRDRLYDAVLVAKNGGVLDEINQANATDGISKMVYKLKSKQIDGFILDKYTMLLFYYIFKDQAEYDHDITFLRSKTIHTEITNLGEQFSYGVLIKHKVDYDFLKHFVRDNRVVLNTCNSLLINKLNSVGNVEVEGNPLFATSGGVFWSSFITISIIIIVLFCFGMIYEFLRKKKDLKSSLYNKKGARV